MARSSGRLRHRDAAFRFLAFSLSLFAAGCTQPGDSATLRASFLAQGDIMAHVPKLKGLGIDTPQVAFHGEEDRSRIDTAEFLSAVGTFLATLTAFFSVGIIILRSPCVICCRMPRS